MEHSAEERFSFAFEFFKSSEIFFCPSAFATHFVRFAERTGMTFHLCPFSHG